MDHSNAITADFYSADAADKQGAREAEESNSPVSFVALIIALAFAAAIWLVIATNAPLSSLLLYFVTVAAAMGLGALSGHGTEGA